MGIDTRLSVLAANSTPAQVPLLQLGCHEETQLAQIAQIRADVNRLISKDAMGLRYKAFAVTSCEDVPPAFEPPA